MNEALRQFLCGAGSVILAPSGSLPPAQLRITLPPRNATEAIAHDFFAISRDLRRAMDKVEHAQQLELQLQQ